MVNVRHATDNEIKIYVTSIKILFNFSVNLDEESVLNLCLTFIFVKMVHRECFLTQVVYK